MTSAPDWKRSLAVRSVIPTPPAEFSPLTITRSGACRSRSTGIASRSPWRPGLPTTSPMKRTRMLLTLSARLTGMVDPEGTAAILERALAYPYAAPAGSYLYRDGAAVELLESDLDLSGRSPLIAYG